VQLAGDARRAPTPATPHPKARKVAVSQTAGLVEIVDPSRCPKWCGLIPTMKCTGGKHDEPATGKRAPKAVRFIERLTHTKGSRSTRVGGSRVSCRASSAICRLTSGASTGRATSKSRERTVRPR
jgi:hypothetical protein